MGRKDDAMLMRAPEGGLVPGWRFWSRRRPGTLLAGLLAASLAGSVLVAAGPPAGGASSASTVRAPGTAAACDPQVVVLPAPTETAWTSVRAMNDAGLVVGVSADTDQGIPAQAVAWRALEPPVALGIGGIEHADGSIVYGWAVDVNEAGVVAAQRSRFRRGRLLSMSAVLWEEATGTTRLPVPPRRRRAEVSALNDHGVAVGSVRGRRTPPVPVYWRRGSLERLPIPSDAKSGYAVDNNNRGLIVGTVVRDDRWWPWWWRRGGRNGPLSLSGLKSTPSVVAVDDRDRIVGLRYRRFDEGSRVLLWRGPSARPRRILGRGGGVVAMHAPRHLAGYSGGFRGIGDRAWVARLGDTRVASLPLPPGDPEGWWANTFGVTLGRGVTAFAPQGGITVGGSAQPEEGRTRAVLWTCAQTYLG